MAQTVNEVMTHDPVTIDTGTPISEAGKLMRDNDTGALIVTENGSVHGIVTDRDIVVRAIADGQDPTSCLVGQVCTANPTTVTPDQSVDDAVRIVREQDVRRVPVVQDGNPVGILSIGDLAIERDQGSALADISSSPANN
jgi:CBS domain-containing protein